MADTIPPMGVQPYGFFVKIAGDIKRPSIAGQRRGSYRGCQKWLRVSSRAAWPTWLPWVARCWQDPDWGTKIAAGKAYDIRRCISCNKGCTDAIQNRQFLSCVLNAENGYENTRSIQPAAQKRRSPSSAAACRSGSRPCGCAARHDDPVPPKRPPLWAAS